MRLGSHLLVLGVFVGCAAPQGSEGGLTIAVAPLSLPQLSKVCYDLRVTNDAGGLGSTVWSEGNPSVDGPTDTGAICSTGYGNGASGDITFVGSCDASPKAAGDVGRTNSVTVWVDGLYDGAGTLISATGNEGWQDPCPSGCTLETLCQENTDAAVEFNLTILRQANQGFFDIGVNFEDIFCSAKVDCRNSGGSPLALLFRPGTGTRDTTVVSALACTAGPGASVQTMLYRDPLVVSCSGATPVVVDPRGQGNAWSTDATPTDAVFQYAVYAGEESLNCGAVSCQKSYWNVAIGLDLARANTCTLSTTMTASSGALTDFETPAASTYPFIKVNVPLTTGTSLTCDRHAVNADTKVATNYTSISQSESFEYDFDGDDFHQKTVILPTSCLALLNAGVTTSGIYTLDVDGAGPLAPSPVYCDQTTDGGGWTLLAYWVGVPSARTMDDLAVSGKSINPFTHNATLYPTVPAGTVNGYSQQLLKNANPQWTNLYGNWVRYSTFASGFTIGSAGFSAVRADGTPITLWGQRGGWLLNSTGSDGYGFFTVWGNGGICGGANTCAQTACPVFYPASYACHFDQSNAKFLFAR